MLHWIYLACAIVLEVTGTTAMKLSHGFTRLMPFALKRIDVSIAYAIWSGIGTAAIAIIGITYFREPATVVKLVSIVLIIIGVVGLNLGGMKH
jgi:small multidrug resistance pump